MSLDQTRDLISEELWLLVPAEEEAYIHSRHRAKVEGTLSQSAFYLAQGYLKEASR